MHWSVDTILCRNLCSHFFIWHIFHVLSTIGQTKKQVTLYPWLKSNEEHNIVEWNNHQFLLWEWRISYTCNQLLLDRLLPILLNLEGEIISHLINNLYMYICKTLDIFFFIRGKVPVENFVSIAVQRACYKKNRS